MNKTRRRILPWGIEDFRFLIADFRLRLVKGAAQIEKTNSGRVVFWASRSSGTTEERPGCQNKEEQPGLSGRRAMITVDRSDNQQGAGRQKDGWRNARGRGWEVGIVYTNLSPNLCSVKGLGSTLLGSTSTMLLFGGDRKKHSPQKARRNSKERKIFIYS
jgi:hypothetical protein